MDDRRNSCPPFGADILGDQHEGESPRLRTLPWPLASTIGRERPKRCRADRGCRYLSSRAARVRKQAAVAEAFLNRLEPADHALFGQQFRRLAAEFSLRTADV